MFEEQHVIVAFPVWIFFLSEIPVLPLKSARPYYLLLIVRVLVWFASFFLISFPKILNWRWIHPLLWRLYRSLEKILISYMWKIIPCSIPVSKRKMLFILMGRNSYRSFCTVTSVTKTWILVGMSVSWKKKSPCKDEGHVLNVHALNEMLLLVYLSSEHIYLSI